MDENVKTPEGKQEETPLKLSAAIDKKYSVRKGYAVKFVTDKLGTPNQNVDLSTESVETADKLVAAGYKGLVEKGKETEAGKVASPAKVEKAAEGTDNSKKKEEK